MRYTEANTDCYTWFERDRANVRLETREGIIIDLWDEAVNEFVEDGFKTRRQTWHEALLDYANVHELDPKE